MDERNGEDFAWGSGLIQSEEDCSEESCRLFVRIGFGLRLDIEYEH